MAEGQKQVWRKILARHISLLPYSIIFEAYSTNYPAQVLKDNEFIEVDANSGIVRRLG